MQQVNIRAERDSVEMLKELHPKVGTAGSTVISIFTYLRRATITELRGRFNPAEIRALGEVYKWMKPSWQMMATSDAIIFNITNAENQKSVISGQGATLEALIKKIEPLTSAQALILQLELISFFEHEMPDVKQLVKALS